MAEIVVKILSIFLALQLQIFYCSASECNLVSFEDYVEAIYQRKNFDPSLDFDAIRNALLEAYAKPLNLNEIMPEALAALGILSKDQMAHYCNHIATTGPLYSKYELQAIPSFDLATITLLLPFVYVMERYQASLPSVSWRNLFQGNDNHCLLRYKTSFKSHAHQKKTDKNPTSLPLGNLDQYTVQISLKPVHDVTVGVTARTQSGEAFVWDHATHRYGFNIWSIFVLAEQKKYCKRVLIGDYQLGYGQGLLLHAGFSMGHGTDVVAMFPANYSGIVPYKGISRIGLRGFACTTELGPIEWTGFYSLNYLDAKLELDDDGSYVRGIDSRGKYDTLYQLSKKGTVGKHLMGCTVLAKYHRHQREVGINLLYHYYDTPIIPKKSDFSSYLFQGDQHVSTSLFYRWLWKNILLFGEWGINLPCFEQNYQGAFIAGSMIGLTRYVSLSTATYYYGKGFYTPYGCGFKHYITDLSNEKGFYGCVKISPVYNWQLLTQGHFFATLRPKPSLSKASSGYVLAVRSSYIWRRMTEWILAYKMSHLPKNVSKTLQGRRDLSNVSIHRKNNFKLKLNHQLRHSWRIGLEGQYMLHGCVNNYDHGYACSNTQKWKGKYIQNGLKITYFNAINHHVATYFYELNPLYSATQFKAYQGHGIAFCWLLGAKFIQKLRLELKYSCTHIFKKCINLAWKKDHNTFDPNKQHITVQCIWVF